MKQHRGILAWLIDEDTRKSTEQLAETVGFTDPARPVKPPNHPSGLESWSLCPDIVTASQRHLNTSLIGKSIQQQRSQPI